MTAALAGAFEIIVELVAVIRVGAVVDNHAGALAWSQSAQIGKSLFGHEDVDIVFGVIHMGDHRDNGGYRTVFGFRFADEY